VGAKANTIRLQEQRIRDAESTINRLEQEKIKLENYAKSTLLTFKNKYKQALEKVKAERKAANDRYVIE